jgi:SpoIIAA-like
MSERINLVCGRRGPLVLLVQSATDPTHVEWDGFLDATAAAMAEHEGTCRVLVLTAGGKPDSEQRAKSLARGWRDNRGSRVAVVTSDPLARGVITIFSWFGMSIRAFHEGKLEDALTWLPLSSLERRWFSVESRILKERLKR